MFSGFRVDTSGTSSSSEFSGEIKALAGATIPAGWLVCNGAAIDRIDFSSLFAAIGTTWGVGDNLATFNIPDLRGRTLIGAGTATAGGSVSAAKFASGEATPHPLGQYDGAERWRVTPSIATGSNPYVSQRNENRASVINSVQNKITFNTKTGDGITSAAGGNLDAEGFAQINMMPYAALNYIIKT